MNPTTDATDQVTAEQPLLALGSGIEQFMQLTPLQRFEQLLAARTFPSQFLTEPIVFEPRDPLYGYACSVEGCAAYLARSSKFCTTHEKQRKKSKGLGVTEPDWLATAQPLRNRPTRSTSNVKPDSCRICPERDVFETRYGLCKSHENNLRKRMASARASNDIFDLDRWCEQQPALPGFGPCIVEGCLWRCQGAKAGGLCEPHRRLINVRKIKEIKDFGKAGSTSQEWVENAAQGFQQGALALSGLPPLAQAEIRYALHAHTQQKRPGQWFPAWLRTLVSSVIKLGVMSITEIDLEQTWTPQQEHVGRIMKQMVAHVSIIHVSRTDTRTLGFIDPLYWGYRFQDRRSSFDLTAISQIWLREMLWDYLAERFSDPRRPRTSGPIEQVRRAIVTLSAFLDEHCSDRGVNPENLTMRDAHAFVADLTRRTEQGLPALGVFLVSGTAAPLSKIGWSLYLNGARGLFRSSLDSGRAEEIRLSRGFITALPTGGSTVTRRPRPLSDEEFALLTNPASTCWLTANDPRDSGLEDIWFIQARCGRRISEVVKLRFDCVSVHSAQTWAWFDMTKVGQLDYGVLIPTDVYDVIQTRQAKTEERYRLATGSPPNHAQRRSIALFPASTGNPAFTNSISTTVFSVAFSRWMKQLNLEGVVPHRARHTLATRLLSAGAPMVVIKQVLGHISEAMSEAYTAIGADVTEPFLQKVWVRGAGSPNPGEVVLLPDQSQTNRAQDRLLDLTALPTEGGLCTFRPVVGGSDCPFNRECGKCEHHVLTGADYTYWKRQQSRWAVLAENAPDDSSRDYITRHFRASNDAIDGLERALNSVGLLEQAKNLDLRSPHQDFFNPLWAQGWRANELADLDAAPTEEDQFEEAAG